MEKLELEVFSQTVNCGIVKMPNRKFPGIVVQGDSLQIMYCDAKYILELAKGLMTESEFIEEIEMLVQKLESYLAIYEHTLEVHNIELPYRK